MKLLILFVVVVLLLVLVAPRAGAYGYSGWAGYLPGGGAYPTSNAQILYLLVGYAEIMQAQRSYTASFYSPGGLYSRGGNLYNYYANKPCNLCGF